MKISRTNDYKLIAALNKHVHDLHVNLYPNYFKEYDYESMKNFFKAVIDQPNFVFLLLEDDEPVGYAWLEMRDYDDNPFWKPRKSIYVHQISIVTSHQGKGYGSRLMEAIYEMAKANGIDKIELDYWVDNEVAKAFYKKHGFVKYREFVFKDL
ncbi:GNAT family N-acetyltransferase [Anoxybacteroides tepidamans]|uniref:GNAT family N-acetyltransferase n=1 Tax=Anoxybacteroides tepidamans TaxID=265948 RepID=UPI000488135E|nr:GNAT family N-acetyltransferase [Anoxybacillus tepidamans]